MKAKINRDGCISCGLCTEICPEVFEMADDGLAKVRKEPTAASADKAHEAAESCPVQVIEIVD